MRRPLQLGWFVVLGGWLWAAWCAGEQGESWPPDRLWSTEYKAAMDAAEKQATRLLVFFHAPGDDQAIRALDAIVAGSPPARQVLQRWVLLKLSTEAVIKVQGKPLRLLDDPAFAKLAHGPGVAIVDFSKPGSKTLGCVVSVHPLKGRAAFSDREVAAILGLPPGAMAPSVQGIPSAESPSTLAQPSAAEPVQPAPGPGTVSISWHTDYQAAMDAAEQAGKMLLIFFHRAQERELCDRFESQTLADPGVAARLQEFVCAKLPADTAIQSGGKRVVVLKHPAFAEMLGRSGIAIIDFHRPRCRHCGQVVSTFPLLGTHPYSVAQMKVILDLPPGTLTQRTLIYAVRTHPERPASAHGQLDPHLVAEAEQHATYQARIRLQGHHFWERRFHRINARLPRGQIACEVCAESWPGQNLLEAAIECVRSWRHSPGHWRAVSAPQDRYGYDMKRGANGVWYATGIFGGRN